MFLGKTKNDGVKVIIPNSDHPQKTSLNVHLMNLCHYRKVTVSDPLVSSIVHPLYNIFDK